MKSKITIEIDFENGNVPFIQVVNDTTTDDVRDKLITSFIQSFQGVSSWCKVSFSGQAAQSLTSSVLTVLKIEPIRPNELPALLEEVGKRTPHESD